jgi:hypothetical protein
VFGRANKWYIFPSQVPNTTQHFDLAGNEEGRTKIHNQSSTKLESAQVHKTKMSNEIIDESCLKENEILGNPR